ncbi:kinase-like domain-containing protein [Rhizophagus clarus]|uniref:Kinase-like domain-containing protein n=1 Tax=Rhizophagus clarus TaxID=94130 RepID=A0A8H3KYF1_9GLOM|nr:kinase-like domain-containing protein [Rhizophagus clarus]
MNLNVAVFFIKSIADQILVLDRKLWYGELDKMISARDTVIKFYQKVGHPFTEELWCKKCDPLRKIEGWTSGNNNVAKFIKDTILIQEINMSMLLDFLNRYFIKSLWSYKRSDTEEFMMVLHFATQGSLRNVLLTKIYGSSNKQKSDDKICIPYIFPPYTLTPDIYSVALDICNGLRQGFGNGTPEFYMKCMNTNSDQRPTAGELYGIDFYIRDLEF